MNLTVQSARKVRVEAELPSRITLVIIECEQEVDRLSNDRSGGTETLSTADEEATMRRYTEIVAGLSDQDQDKVIKAANRGSRRRNRSFIREFVRREQANNFKAFNAKLDQILDRVNQPLNKPVDSPTTSAACVLGRAAEYLTPEQRMAFAAELARILRDDKPDLAAEEALKNTYITIARENASKADGYKAKPGNARGVQSPT